MPIITLKDVGKGVNKDLLPSELGAGFWSDCSNVRFRNGFAENFEGAQGNIAAGNPYWISPYSDGTTLHGMWASNERFFTGTTDITRSVEGAVISSITRVGTTATLTTATNHGITTGNTVSIWGASPSQYNGTYVVTVTGATTFTYTMASDPGASASPVGLYSWDSAGVTLFTGARDDRWSGGSLNGIFLANNPIDGLYYWSGDTSARVRKVPLSYVADVTRPFKTYAVQLAPTINGVKFPQTVLWSASANPGSLPATFVPASTNDARSVPLAETPGAVIDCLPLGDVNIVYKKDSIYSMQFVGGEFVFRFTRLPGNDGLFFRGCVAETPVGHVFLTQDYDIKIHNGDQPRSLIDGRLKDWLRQRLATSSAPTRAFMCVNRAKEEVWFVYPFQSECVNAAVWNWKDDTWGLFDFPSTRRLLYGQSGSWNSAFAGVSGEPNADLVLSVSIQEIPGAGSIGPVYSTLSSNLFFSKSYPTYLIRDGLHFDDRSSLKTLQRSRWNFENIGGNTALVQHGAAMTASGTPTMSASASYTVGTTDFVSVRSTSGRYLSIRVDPQTTKSFRLRSVDLDISKGGTR